MPQTLTALSERICRLLLPLSTSMHIVAVDDAGEEHSAGCCSAECCRESLLSPRSPTPPPTVVNYPPAYSRRLESSSMPRKRLCAPPQICTRLTRVFTAPDVLLSRTPKRPLCLDLAPEAASDSPPRGRRGHRPNLAIDENCHLSLRDDSKEPRTFQPVKPTRRFGILFTMSRQHHRHNR